MREQTDVDHSADVSKMNNVIKLVSEAANTDPYDRPSTPSMSCQRAESLFWEQTYGIF